jgi:hypothetical protein
VRDQIGQQVVAPRAPSLACTTPLAASPIPDVEPPVEVSPLPRSGRVLVAYRGLPGSGKTTHAEARVAALRRAGTSVARVSRDDIWADLRQPP